MCADATRVNCLLCTRYFTAWLAMAKYGSRLTMVGDVFINGPRNLVRTRTDSSSDVVHSRHTLLQEANYGERAERE